MEYNKIISISGLGGLFELISSKNDGAVVRSLEDNTSKFVSNRVHNFSHLESIEVFTNKDNANLAEVFDAVGKSAEPLPDPNADGKALKSYFEIVYPDLDFTRVYASDLKKMVKWYNILKANNIVAKAPAEESEEVVDEKPEPQDEPIK